jgi:hypothetical protein
MTSPLEPEQISTLERTLWVVERPPDQPITAAIFRLEAGFELRVSCGDDPTLLDTDVSDDDEALEWRAEMLLGVLEANGWLRRPIPN